MSIVLIEMFKFITIDLLIIPNLYMAPPEPDSIIVV